MKYLWLIFPAIAGGYLAHMGINATQLDFWVLMLCSSIPSAAAMNL